MYNRGDEKGLSHVVTQQGTTAQSANGQPEAEGECVVPRSPGIPNLTCKYSYMLGLFLHVQQLGLQ